MSLSASEVASLLRGASRFGLSVTPAQIDAIGTYLDLLLKWRDHARLVSRKQSRADLIDKHIIDSLALCPHLTGIGSIADLGSGAGFPGIPVAILMPEATVTLIEANGRKANFLREVVRQLGLTQVSVLNQRVEDVRPTEQFAAVVSRAVWNPAELLAAARGLLAPGGVVIAMVGPSLEGEVRAEPFGFTLAANARYELEAGEQRSLLLLRPVSRETPSLA